MLAIAGMASAASALAGAGPDIALGTIPFPPGPEAVQVGITLQPNADTVTATPLNANPYMGAPRVFPYNGTTGKGFQLVQALAVPFQVVNENSATPGVIFWEYVPTGDTYKMRLVKGPKNTKDTVKQNIAYVDGIWILVTINQNGTPGTVTVTQIGKNKNTSFPTLTSEIYQPDGIAPFIMGQTMYTVNPKTSLIEKWMLYANNTTNGIFTAGFPFPLPL